MITTLRDAPHQHKSRFGHKVLATSTTCDQSKSECSIIDQRSNIRGARHGGVKKNTASVRKSLQRPTTCRPSQRGHSYSWIIQRKESDGSQTYKSGWLSNRCFDKGHLPKNRQSAPKVTLSPRLTLDRRSPGHVESSRLVFYLSDQGPTATSNRCHDYS